MNQQSNQTDEAQSVQDRLAVNRSVEDQSQKSFVLTLVLCFFFGALGVHRFYLGKALTGFLMLITLGGFGLWALIDLVMILIGKFDDADGRPIRN